MLRRNIIRGKIARFAWRTLRRPRDTRTRYEDDMECTINWQPASGMAFVAETGSGHLLAMDGAPDGGGRNLAPRPMETVLAGTGGCTAYDVVLILRRGRHDVRGCQVKVSAERADREPKVFTKIHMHFVVSGRGLPAVAVERAIALSHEKYCSASIMLGKTADVTTSFELLEA
jgi:putative redox protein